MGGTISSRVATVLSTSLSSKLVTVATLSPINIRISLIFDGAPTKLKVARVSVFTSERRGTNAETANISGCDPR